VRWIDQANPTAEATRTLQAGARAGHHLIPFSAPTSHWASRPSKPSGPSGPRIEDIEDPNFPPLLRDAAGTGLALASPFGWSPSYNEHFYSTIFSFLLLPRIHTPTRDETRRDETRRISPNPLTIRLPRNLQGLCCAACCANPASAATKESAPFCRARTRLGRL
jgi:hypothetical protein